ncbi:MAG: DUF6152 family protein [Pseudomonadales bacterium]|nr:DUF6152 family protein [Pseudomonadales bacterium]
MKQFTDGISAILSSATQIPAMLAIAGFFAAPALAHHSVVGEFDTSREVELRGTVTKVEWYNPHIWLALNVIREDGRLESWDCEMGSPNQLIRLGWKKTDLPIGTVIRTRGNPARDDSKTCTTRTVTLDDGTPVFSRVGRPE